ncbi:MAG TPA: hypothetical protein VNE59_00450 [Burkholderiales bacterium]|nr:hypothetical protein [Burkholderiales bacterium]
MVWQSARAAFVVALIFLKALLLPGVWALRSNATAYDAAYLALAEVLGATLVTRDAALASIPGHAVRVEVIG